MARIAEHILFSSYFIFFFFTYFHVSATPTDCAGMFTTGILTADASTLVSTSSSSDLEAYKAVANTSMAWCSQEADIYQFLQVNLGRVRNITSIGIQGYKPGFVSYITSFTISYTHDDNNWKYFKDESNSIKTFSNFPVDENDVISHPLDTLSAIRIRINPQSWQNWICMRIELFTCDPVDGGVSEWTPWGPCMTNDTQIRTRLCDSPPPVRGGLSCKENFTMSQSCAPNITVPMASSDPCQSNPCRNGSQCILSGNNNYTCNCTPGFLGYNCSFLDPCLDNPCKNGTTCVPFHNSLTIDYTCNCTEGFSGKNCTNHDVKEIYWEFIPSEEMHKLKKVVVPVVTSVATTAVVSGSVGFVYWVIKSKLAKVVPIDRLTV